MSVAEPIQQACAIPFRIVQGQPEFCLITSIRTGKWGFPKGIIDPGETPEEACLKEAHEEAGLSGRVVGVALGGYSYSKWGTTLWVTVFLMEITGVASHWDEAAVRKRRFCRTAEARELLAEARQRGLFEQALKRLGAAG